MAADQSMTRLPEPVVILGGGGFIGSNLGKALYDSGYAVELVDVDFKDWRWGTHAVQYHLDLRDPTQCQLAIDGAGTVFHLAADMGGVEYFHSDADFAAALTNQLITTNVLKACTDAKVQRLIYASSVCAGDTELQMREGRPYPIHETDIISGDPDARYGAEKRHGAYMVANAPLDTRVALLNTVYGPGQEHEGVRMKFPSAVATGAIKSLDTGTLVLFGNGKQMRPYMYIDDAVACLIQLAEADSEMLKGEFNDFNTIPNWLERVFCIGSTVPVTCTDVAETCLDIVGSDATIVYNPAKPSGVLARSTSMHHWYSVFGPLPEQTSIEEGFTKFIEWLQSV